MTDVIMTRAEARAQGLKRYVSALTCPKCSTSIRLTNGGCVECTRLYSLAWKADNPARTRAITQRWKAGNPGAGRSWHVGNREKSRAACRRYYDANQEAMQQRARDWGKQNPEKVAANTNKRRAKIKNASGSHTAADVRAILEAQCHRCAYCRADLRKVKKHLDHIEPLARGGSNDPANLQWLCASCNLSKGARDPIKFARDLGRLL